MAPRELPHDLQAERELLACCMLDTSAIGRAIEAGVRPDTFYGQHHGHVFGVIVEMVSAGAVVESWTVLQELIRRKLHDPNEGHGAFTQISDASPTSALTEPSIARIIELSALRGAIRIATAMVEKAYAYAGEGLSEVIDSPISQLLTLTTRDGKTESTWAEVVDQAAVIADEIIAHKGKPLGASIPFPWEQLNEKFGAMERGQLVVLAARTSIGKSSLSRPIALHAASSGHKVYYDTIEVKPARVALQMAATISRLGVRQLGNAHGGEQQDFKRALLNLRTLGITISGKDRALPQIIARTRALSAQGKLDLVIIDHGGYIDEIAKADQHRKAGAIGIVTKALKTLAVDLNVVIILLWQLNRGSSKESNREPILSDLKDSGSVEEDADKVIFIHRPTDDPITNRAQSDFASVEDCPRFFQNVFQAKGRDEGTTLQSFYFNRRIASFEPIVKT